MFLVFLHTNHWRQQKPSYQLAWHFLTRMRKLQNFIRLRMWMNLGHTLVTIKGTLIGHRMGMNWGHTLVTINTTWFKSLYCCVDIGDLFFSYLCFFIYLSRSKSGSRSRSQSSSRWVNLFMFKLKQMWVVGMMKCKVFYCIQVNVFLLAKCHILLYNLLWSCLKFFNKKFRFMMCGIINENVKSKTSYL